MAIVYTNLFPIDVKINTIFNLTDKKNEKNWL